jgi:hypothetical protein
VRRVCAEGNGAFAIGECGELFSWGRGYCWRLGHGDTQHHPSPKRVEALRDVQVISAVVGTHAIALSEDGLVYAWGKNCGMSLLGNPNVERLILPELVEALWGVRVGAVTAARRRSYAVADTGEVWAWGDDGYIAPPTGHGERRPCPLPKPIESLRGVKVDAVVASYYHTLALAGDGSVYSWGDKDAAASGALGLGSSVSDAGTALHTPQRSPARTAPLKCDWPGHEIFSHALSLVPFTYCARATGTVGGCVSDDRLRVTAKIGQEADGENARERAARRRWQVVRGPRAASGGRGEACAASGGRPGQSVCMQRVYGVRRNK